MGRSFKGCVRHAGSTAGLTAVVVSLATVGATASAAVMLAAHPRATTDGASGRALDVLPFPGTPDAAAGTDIDFPAVAPKQVRSVTVVGSRSGLHAGRISAQPAGQGTAFAPDQPFSPGERVSVTAIFRSAAAGSASGASGTRQISFSFSVARPVSVTSSAVSGDAAGTASRSAARYSANSPKTHSFVTEPGFRVPWITKDGNDTDTTQGRIFLSTQNFGQSAAYMVNGKGDIQWWHPARAVPGFGGSAARMTR